ncbi:VacJ family lipoprotein [Elusimicrobiota bacterium]
MIARGASFALFLSLLLAAAPPLAVAQDDARAEPGAQAEAAGSEDGDFGELDEFAGEFEPSGGQDDGERRVFDPLRGYNRVMFKVNDKFYFWVAKPMVRGYGKVVPKKARIAFGRAFHNLHFPLRFVNCLLQLKLKKAGAETGRFLVNSTAGVGGLFDPADRFLKWRRPGDEDFGQTFGHYGAGDGFPVVLPIVGSSNLRDGLGMVPSIMYNPMSYVADFETTFALTAGEQFNWLSLHVGEYESMKKDALDPYTFLRDVYKQNRDKKIGE